MNIPLSRLQSRPPLDAMVALAAELATLKRLRDAQSPESVAARLFRRAWNAVLSTPDIATVALGTTADALVALRLGTMDTGVLGKLGVPAEAARAILLASFDQVADSVTPGLREQLRSSIGGPIPVKCPLPDFAEALIRQPRAGATCPGKPRVVLEPPENHGEHCLVVAVLGVLLSGHYDADPAAAFMAGLAHHLHNAMIPDAGFAGEMLLGEHLAPVMQLAFDTAFSSMPGAAAQAANCALRLTRDADTAEGRAFNAADVIDRIMEMRHFAEVASFTTAQAVDEMELVHAGPLQEFHYLVMREAGLLPSGQYTSPAILA